MGNKLLSCCSARNPDNDRKDKVKNISSPSSAMSISSIKTTYSLEKNKK